jgi:hypothetical protein
VEYKQDKEDDENDNERIDYPEFLIYGFFAVCKSLGKCKESAADRVRLHNISTNSNPLHCKSIYMHHERRCTNVLSIHIQDSKKIATRLLDALILTCLVLTFTSTT